MRNKSIKNQSIDIKKAIGTAMIIVSAFLLLCLITRSALLGIVGKAISDFFLGVFGIVSYALMLGILVAGIMVVMNRKVILPKLQIANFAIMFFAITLLIHAITSAHSAVANSFSAYLSACYDFSAMTTFGGAFGGLFLWPLCNAITIFGAYIFILALLILTVFICAEYFFKISNLQIERTARFVKKDIAKESFIQPQYPKNKLFVATINESQPKIVVQPQPKVNKAYNELYNERLSDDSISYELPEPRVAPSAHEQLYGDYWRNSEYQSTSSRRSAMPSQSYTEDYERRSSIPKNNDNIVSAPMSTFNKPFDEPPAILHGDDQYTGDTFNIQQTDEFLAEKKPAKRTKKETAKKDLYALKGNNMEPDETLPPIVNGEEVSAQLKKKEVYEQFNGASGTGNNIYNIADHKKEEPIVAPKPTYSPAVNKNETATTQSAYKPSASPISPAPFVKVEDKSSETVAYTENKEMERVAVDEPIYEVDLLDDKELEDISIAEAITEPKYDEIELEKEEPVKFVEKPFLNKNSNEKGFQVGFAAAVGDDKKEEKPVHKYEKYVPPVLQLLDDAAFDPNVVNEDYEAIGKNIEQLLAQFKVESTLVNIIHGPTVTRYEYQIASGISVKRVTSLADDISMVVASKSSVRIEAPIRGKNLFGIEVPNAKVAKVPLRSVLESADFQNSSHALTFALGIDIGGQKIVADLADMPHLLIAGSTGQGKSVCMNSLIISLLYKYGPEDLRFILVDPKRVEFSVYNKLPHLMINDIICEPEKAISAFNWLIKEMERRFTLFAEYGVRDIKGYNLAIDTETTQKLPRIVLVVDEVADLMQYNKSEIEQRIQKLAQKARAAGIHLVMATQRPSVDIITGVIKANFPARIALRVTTAADSKTILAQGGPEKLLGKGDMFFQTANMSDPLRLQGALITDDEVKEVVNFIAANNECYFDEEVATAIMKAKQASSNGGGDDDDLDDLFYDALKYVIDTGSASISMLQRRFSIGYNRAGRLIQDMEEKHFVSQFEGAKPRQVLITAEEYEQLFNEQ